MHILMKQFESDCYSLRVAETIFLRPTPWLVAWKAGFDYVLRKGRFGFVYLPMQYVNPANEYECEKGKLIVRGNEETVFSTPIEPLTFRNWFFYGIESFAYGFFWKFWEWRYDSGVLNRKELQGKLEQLEHQIELLFYGESGRK